MLGNWIKQTTTTTGTGNLTLSSVSGFPQFTDQFSTTDYFYYAILDDSTGAPIETGIGHLSDSTTLVRDKVLATYVSGTYSDNDPSAVTLAAGTKRVICAMEQGAVQATPANIATISGMNRSIYPTGVIVKPSATGVALVQNIAYYVPIIIKTPRTIDAAQFRVSVAGAGSTTTVGIYSAGVDGKPKTRIDVSASIDTSTTGVKTGTFTKRRYKPGLYFIAVSTTGGSAPTLNQGDTAGSTEPLLGGDANNLGGIGAMYESAGSGILPATAAVTTGTRTLAETPLLSLRLA